MDRQPQLYLYELHTGRRGPAGGRGGAVARGGRPRGAGGGGRRRRRPKNSTHLVGPLLHHAQEPNIPFGDPSLR